MKTRLLATRTTRLHLAFLGWCLCCALAHAQTYSCGDVSSDPVEVPSGTGGESFTRTLGKAATDTLCMLFRVTPASDDGTLDDISRTSNLADYHIVPVARSANGSKWKRVAGPYAQHLTVSSCGIKSNPTCDVHIPILPNLTNGKFILMSFTNPTTMTDREKVSRFFHQTTFGPTMSMIDEFDYGGNGGNLNMNMASWMHEQMYSTDIPLTSHREYFRHRVDGSFHDEIEDPNEEWDERQMLKARLPCNAGSRWTEYAFTNDDFGQEVVVTQRSPQGDYLITVDGIPRTVMSEWKNRDNGNDLRLGGNWGFCWYTEETLYGTVCFEDWDNDTGYYIKGGNPRINLPISDPNVKIINNLPSKSDGFLATPWVRGAQPWQPYLKYGETLLMKNPIPMSRCTNIGIDYTNTVNVIGYLNGNSNNQVRYARYVELDENTLDNPLVDGGGDLYDVKGVCSNPAMNFINAESCYMTTVSNACASSYVKEKVGDAVMICGSIGEVANGSGEGDHINNTFHLGETTNLKFDDATSQQKKNVFNMIALSADDQLRQRVAWALSQILVITPNQIDEGGLSEAYLAYYDIFVRNAFGNYFDILKEVAYSPMMAEMLSYLDSKSKSFVLKDDETIAFPDENFAREIMQLFSIGVHMLNMDGTPVLNEEGLPIPTYDNTDIQNFARAWTGFTAQNVRSNVESRYMWTPNRIDPMRFEGIWRDPFPKMGLGLGLDGNSFIGDGYPLCVDEPDRPFLRRGAMYRLIGSSVTPTAHFQPEWWLNHDDYTIKVLALSQDSALYSALCNGTPGNCSFETVVTLDANLSCDDPTHPECDTVDDLRLVQVQADPPVHYEYVRPPCVQLAFYDNGRTIQHHWPRDAMCANGRLALATDTCCEDPKNGWSGGTSFCKHTAEKISFLSSKARCESSDVFPNGGVCHWRWLDQRNHGCNNWSEDDWYWTGDEACTLRAKVSSTGTVAIVHDPYIDDVSEYVTDINANIDNTNFFKVSWQDGVYPSPSNLCADSGCMYYNGESCVCDIKIQESSVFSSIPTAFEITTQLHIGGVNIMRFDDGEYTELETGGGVTAWQKNGGGYDANTIFSVDGKYFRNVLSMVQVRDNPQMSFRNPPHFMNPVVRDPRDAEYETEAVLNHYFRHPNVAPFLAQRMIQRFGISNPSPDYIQSVAKAFTTGSVSYGGQDFGSGNYGDMGSMVAAIVMHGDARNPLFDADPTSGSLREPLIKLLSFLRAMEFHQEEWAPNLNLWNLQNSIGQEAHAAPNVFSFFLPEYSPGGHIKAASLTSPESQVLTGPKLVSMLNGFFSLIDLGLTECYGGFGDLTTWWCPDFFYDNPYTYPRGYLEYENQSTGASIIVDNLALLLTGGRLHADAKSVIVSAFQNADEDDKLQIAQKLITTTPEFHATGIFDSQAGLRPDIPIPPPSGKGYKAVVFVMLDGGSDSYNMLVPHSGCSLDNDMYQEYKRVRTGLAIPKDDLLQIDASGSGQECSVFGHHPRLGHLKDLYDEEDLLWISNMGVLQQHVTKDDWWSKTSETALFAHNVQYSEVHNMDIYDSQAGRGVGGRMVDVLKKNGFTVDTISADGVAECLVSSLTSQIVVEAGGFDRFDPMSAEYADDPDEILNYVKNMNKVANLGSNLFSETWASLLHQGLHDNQMLYDALQDVVLDTPFTQDNWLSIQFETIAKMMKTKDARGADRDVYFASMGGYDTHSNLNDIFDDLMTEFNVAMSEFTTEMKQQEKWDSVTIVMVSEFARTLTENTGQGSDHAWGGNYFVAGGQISGKKILGQYPNALNPNGPLVFEPGIVIPTTPWDSMWYGIAEWFGIVDPSDLSEILPNKGTFPVDEMFTMEELYGMSPPPVTPPPVSEPSPSPSPVPSIQPSSASCMDSPLKMKIGRAKKFCTWAANKRKKRCKKTGVPSHCPDSCQASQYCTQDSAMVFDINKKNLDKKCNTWVAKKKKRRCGMRGVCDTCRSTCTAFC